MVVHAFTVTLHAPLQPANVFVLTIDAVFEMDDHRSRQIDKLEFDMLHISTIVELICTVYFAETCALA